MWKLWNKLFGWDYIYWENNYRSNWGISRVRNTDDGVTYFIKGSNKHVIVNDTNYCCFLFLTCKASKYLGENK